MNALLERTCLPHNGILILRGQPLTFSSKPSLSDDGLGVIKQSSKEIKKTIISEMLKIGFDIIINIGNTSTGFLDVTLDQSSNIFCPFKKPDSKTCYISNRSNHTKILEKISQI